MDYRVLFGNPNIVPVLRDRGTSHIANGYYRFLIAGLTLYTDATIAFYKE